MWVIAAVSVVLPWSTWPMVPMLQWGFCGAGWWCEDLARAGGQPRRGETRLAVKSSHAAEGSRGIHAAEEA